MVIFHSYVSLPEGISINKHGFVSHCSLLEWPQRFPFRHGGSQVTNGLSIRVVMVMTTDDLGLPPFSEMEAPIRGWSF